MEGRGVTSARLHAVRKTVRLAMLAALLGAASVVVCTSPAAAADQSVTVAAGGSAGPVSAEIGDLITIVGVNRSVTDLDVPGHGVLPLVEVSLIPSPGSVSYAASGLKTETISFSDGSVISPTDVPAQDILDALAASPPPPGTLQVDVAPAPALPPLPPRPPPRPPPPPPPIPPTAASTTPSTTRATLPGSGPDSARPAVPPELTGEPSTEAPAAVTAGTREGSSRDAGAAATTTAGTPSGFEIAAAAVPTAEAGAFDDLPMALRIPPLLAVLSICVVAAALGRVHREGAAGRR